jgi:undecaprenyl diphosphate synthase
MEENKWEHVGVIMDGNRRWARKNKLQSVLKGHEKGVDKFMELCVWCLDREIPYLTVYAFSTENWNRSSVEVDGLFSIMDKFFNDKIGECIERGIRIRVVGDRTMLKEKQLRTIRLAEQETAQCDKLLVQVAISYGGRNELTRAIYKLVSDEEEGKIQKESISEELVESYLDTAGVPMIDMVIRTGGNHRLSNFFIWQAAYAEIYFTDTLWPDFTEEEFQQMLEDYRHININMGK